MMHTKAPGACTTRHGIFTITIALPLLQHQGVRNCSSYCYCSEGDLREPREIKGLAASQ
jgi:hypothetical protein